jgi:hypothetical protein
MQDQIETLPITQDQTRKESSIPICQSFGVREHQREHVASKGIDIPIEGSETAYFGGWRGEYECKKKSLEIEPSEDSPWTSRKQAESTIEQNMTFDPCQEPREEDSIEISTDTRRRLKQLGYR